MSASRAPARPPQGAAPRPGGPQRGPMFAPHIEAPKDYRRTLRRLLGYFGAYRVLMIAATVFIAAGTLLRSLGPALIGEAIKYDLELSKNLPDFVHRMGIVLATILGSWIADAGAGILMTRLSNNIVYRLREDSFAHVQTLSMGSFDKRGIGDFISRMTNDIEMIFNAMNNGFSSLVGGLLTVLLGVWFDASIVRTVPALLRSRLLMRVAFSPLKKSNSRTCLGRGGRCLPFCRL